MSLGFGSRKTDFLREQAEKIESDQESQAVSDLSGANQMLSVWAQIQGKYV